MDKVLSLDAQTVTIPANMSYGQLAPYLHEHGFCLAQPHIAPAHLRCRRLRHRDPQVREKRQPGYVCIGF